MRRIGVFGSATQLDFYTVHQTENHIILGWTKKTIVSISISSVSFTILYAVETRFISE